MAVAVLKRTAELEPTVSAERAALSAAIAAAADADARKLAVNRAHSSASSAVWAARTAVEVATAGIETARADAVRHLTDAAMGTAGEAPVSPAEARTRLAQAQDHLTASIAARDALQAEVAEQQRRGLDFPAMRVAEGARAVIRVEMRERAVALAVQVQQLQRQLVADGSALRWLSDAGVFPTVTKFGDPWHGQLADRDVHDAILRMRESPWGWQVPVGRGDVPFARPTGADAWQAAFEALQRDAQAQLPGAGK